MTSRVVHVAPVLPQDVRQQALALDQAGLLGTIVGSWVPGTGGRADALLCRWTSTRVPLPLDQQRVRTVPISDLASRLVRFASGSPVRAQDVQFALVDAAAARLIPHEGVSVLAREDGALRSFARARRVGGKCLYDLPTAHFAVAERILREEEASFPGLATTSVAEIYTPRRKERKSAELEMADAVVCPSAFVGRTLVEAGVSSAKIRVLPFAGDADWLGRAHPRRPGATFLVVGSLSVRKGVHRLLLAWKQLAAYRTHRLLLVGDMQLPAKFLSDFAGMYEHIERVPRDQLSNIYASARALLFPSLAEGFGLVITEAMSHGVPVLTTWNTGADGLVTPFVDGILVPAADQDALTDAMDWALGHAVQLEEMGRRARARVARRTWDHYRREFADAVRGILADEEAESPSTPPPPPVEPHGRES